MRPITALSAVSLRGVTPASVDSPLPELKWVSPTEIFVETEYQRDLSERSIKMIRKMIAGWRWAHVKPVICARVGGKLMALDGQHTAIAAATIGVKKVPAMVVSVRTVKERAEAFVGQNCDRLNLTPAHVYYASLTAGEEIAVAIDQVCRRVGITVLKGSKGGAPYKVGETFAIGLIRSLVKRYGVNFAARLLKILVDAKRAPINAVEIAAVAILLRDPAYAGKVDAFDLATAIRSAPIQEHLAKAANRVAKGAKRRIALAEVLLERSKRSIAA